MSDVRLTVFESHGRKQVSSGSKWEPLIGYCRAVRAGNIIAVTGTVGINADGTYPPTLADQARRSLTIVKAAVEALGGKVSDVIRTRMFVTDIGQWEALGRVHGEFFGDIRPATTMVEVTKLIDTAALVEIEADAVVG
jgi:enamine deaminase RidA (YjgF/YER057c/UK114 family)